MKPSLLKGEAQRAYEILMKAHQACDRLIDHLAPKDHDEYRAYVMKLCVELHSALVRIEQRLQAMRK